MGAASGDPNQATLRELWHSSPRQSKCRTRFAIVCPELAISVLAARPERAGLIDQQSEVQPCRDVNKF